MDEEIRQLLRRNYELARENNKMLRKMRRGMLISQIIKILVAAAIIGVPIYLYYSILQPLLADVATGYQSLQEGVDSTQEIFQNIPFLGNLLEPKEVTEAAEVATTTLDIVD